MRIATRRLSLEPCPGDLLAAALAPREATRSPLVRLPSDWPEAEAVLLFAEQARLGREDPARAPWGPWVVWLGDEIVGDAGFKGPPDESGAVELSYYVRPAHRRRGFASEAVAAVVSWSFDHEARTVRAECHPDNAASIRLLRSLGFALASADEDSCWFEKSAP